MTMQHQIFHFPSRSDPAGILWMKGVVPCFN